MKGGGRSGLLTNDYDPYQLPRHQGMHHDAPERNSGTSV